MKAEVESSTNGPEGLELVAREMHIAELDRFWEKEQTKGDVEAFILDSVFTSLPTPPFTPAEKQVIAANES